jgi:hypothetical protein
MFDAIAARHALVDLAELVWLILGDEDADASPDDFLRRKAIDPFGAAVPGEDRSVEILRQDRIVGRLDDRGKNARGRVPRVKLVAQGVQLTGFSTNGLGPSTAARLAGTICALRETVCV